MKSTTKRLFSNSAENTEYYYNAQSKIELLSCPNNKSICQEHLAVVNKCYIESEQAIRDKDYPKAIESLKDAFYKTTELVDISCLNCAKLFRSTIIESVEDLHTELEKMTSGFFGRKKRHQTSYQKAIEILNEFEQFKFHDTFKTNENKKRYIGNYLKQKVS